MLLTFRQCKAQITNRSLSEETKYYISAHCFRQSELLNAQESVLNTRLNSLVQTVFKQTFQNQAVSTAKTEIIP